MKLISWNVNSVRLRLPRLLALLERHEPDVLCLQETKVVDESFPSVEIAARGYRCATYGQKGYNGVALISRPAMESVERGFAGDPAGEARVISAEISGVRVSSVYVVNGQSLGSDKYELKLAWLDAFRAFLAASRDPGEPLVVMGDFNIAPSDADVYDPRIFQNRVLCSEEERARFRALIDWGLLDLLRCRHPEGGHYTWWDYRYGAYRHDRGLRIDLALGTTSIADRLSDVVVDRAERADDAGEGKPSDHAPLIVSLS